MTVFDQIAQVIEWTEPLYKHLHAHPELSMRETETAAEITRRLQGLGYQVQQVGGGVVGVLANGDGPVVLTRADFDALPVTEASGLDYASTVTTTDDSGATVGVMHACGHDMHVACQLGACDLLQRNREAWRGTHIALFQPGEETAAGARSMVDAGLVGLVPKPDVCLGQHVMGTEAGKVFVTEGPALATGDSCRVVVHGIGSHGSMPHLSVDPVVLAASIVLRLQTIVSRILAPDEFGVLTVGSLQAGSKANVIPDQAVLELNVRAYDSGVRDRIIGAIERIVRAECQASGSPSEPTFEYHDVYPLTSNDAATTRRVCESLVQQLGEERVEQMVPATGSEDFSIIPSAFGVPYCFWTFGGFDPSQPAVGNHNPRFAPLIHPTLETGTMAMTAAVLGWLGA